MVILLATKLRNRRKELGLSQAELALGICEQGQISRIEKGKYNPGSELLYLISKKLGVTLNYFFEEGELEDVSFLEQFKILARKFLDNRDYESLKYIYDLEIVNFHKLSLLDQIYLEWIESIIDFHYLNKQQEAIAKLEATLKKINHYNLDYFNLANSLLNFYSLVGDNDHYENSYYRLMEKLKENTKSTLEEVKLQIKVRYNFCRYLWVKKAINQAIEETLEAMEICKKHQTYYLLADLYCLMGNISEEFSNLETVKPYFKMAQYLYRLSGDEKMSLSLENYIKESSDIV